MLCVCVCMCMCVCVCVCVYGMERHTHKAHFLMHTDITKKDIHMYTYAHIHEHNDT